MLPEMILPSSYDDRPEHFRIEVSHTTIVRDTSASKCPGRSFNSDPHQALFRSDIHDHAERLLLLILSRIRTATPIRESTMAMTALITVLMSFSSPVLVLS